jgi:DNA polymerase-1
MQLVNERTVWLDTMRDRRFGPPEVRARFGVDPGLVPDVLGLMGDAIDNIPGVKGIGEKTASILVHDLGPVETILDRLDEVERLPIRGAKKVRDMLAAEAETARLSKALATIKCDVPVALDLDALRWEGPDHEQLRPLFAELEFSSLLRELAPTGEAPEVERCTVRSAAEITAALAPLAASGTVAVVAVLDSVRATAARMESLAVAGPSGPVTLVTAPDEPASVAALAPLLGDLAVTKIGGDVKALRVALARRGVALAGPTFDLSLASYCLNPSRAAHDVAGLAEEYLGLARDDGAEPASSRAALRAPRTRSGRSSRSGSARTRWTGSSASSRCRSPTCSPEMELAWRPARRAGAPAALGEFAATLERLMARSTRSPAASSTSAHRPSSAASSSTASRSRRAVSGAGRRGSRPTSTC